MAMKFKWPNTNYAFKISPIKRNNGASHKGLQIENNKQFQGAGISIIRKMLLPDCFVKIFLIVFPSGSLDHTAGSRQQNRCPGGLPAFQIIVGTLGFRKRISLIDLNLHNPA